MTRGRPIRGIFGGFFLGICIDLDLIFGGAVKLDSTLLTILPVALLVVGFALGMWAPIGRRRTARHLSGGPESQSLPPPMAWPESAPTEGSTPPPPFGSNLGGEAPPPPPPTPPI